MNEHDSIPTIGRFEAGYDVDVTKVLLLKRNAGGKARKAEDNEKTIRNDRANLQFSNESIFDENFDSLTTFRWIL